MPKNTLKDLFSEFKEQFGNLPLEYKVGIGVVAGYLAYALTNALLGLAINIILTALTLSAAIFIYKKGNLRTALTDILKMGPSFQDLRLRDVIVSAAALVASVYFTPFVLAFLYIGGSNGIRKHLIPEDAAKCDHAAQQIHSRIQNTSQDDLNKMIISISDFFNRFTTIMKFSSSSTSDGAKHEQKPESHEPRKP